MKRKVDDKTYLNYLLQSLNVNDLKQICRDFKVKGFSKWKKEELIENILGFLSEEELVELIKEKELKIISDAIDLAIEKINGKDRERITDIKIINADKHEIEVKFRGFSWDIGIEMSIKEDNIDDPERICDCRVGSNGGFCNHFWVGFIFSLKQGYFKLSDWALTPLPDDFEKRINTIKISGEISEGEGKASLIDESSENFQLQEYTDKSITIYEGEVDDIQQKKQVFQEIETIYYLVVLKNVRFGPRIQRKSDFKEENLRNVEKLNLRISEKLKTETDFKKGDKLNVNGKLVKDNFLKMFIVKNIRKVSKL